MRFDLSDVLLFLSLVCLGVFAWLIWPPAVLLPCAMFLGLLSLAAGGKAEQ